MFYLIAFIILFLAVLAVAIYFYIIDRKYVKSKILDTMSNDVRKEIEEELAELERKKTLFEDCLKKAGRR